MSLFSATGQSYLKGMQAMMPYDVTTVQLEANIVLSRGHVARQHAVIARLAEEGHPENLATAKALLRIMHGHLAAEVDMLAGMAPI